MIHNYLGKTREVEYTCSGISWSSYCTWSGSIRSNLFGGIITELKPATAEESYHIDLNHFRFVNPNLNDYDYWVRWYCSKWYFTAICKTRARFSIEHSSSKLDFNWAWLIELMWGSWWSHPAFKHFKVTIPWQEGSVLQMFGWQPLHVYPDLAMTALTAL